MSWFRNNVKEHNTLCVLTLCLVIGSTLSACGADGIATTTVGTNPGGQQPTPAPTPAPGTGAATLYWTTPTQNQDGTPLTDLAGFKIYYSQQANIWTNVVQVTNPLATSGVVTGLNTGRTYFTVTGYDQDGNESGYSNVRYKDVN